MFAVVVHFQELVGMIAVVVHFQEYLKGTQSEFDCWEGQESG